MTDILKCFHFVNKMCFKITFAMLCILSLNLSWNSQNAKVFAWHSIVFLLFYLAVHQSCINILCHILYVCY